jgi:hypothetical protein
MDSWLDLLKSVNVDISREDWAEHHPQPEVAEARTEPGMDPVFVHDDVPYFSAAQVDWCDPSVFGHEDFGVVEDADSAHPMVLSWADEQYYRANYRAKHRYSRPYRLRWTLAHVVGYYGKCNADVLAQLRERQAGERKDVMRTRGAYEWVRKQLALLGQSKLNLSIPSLVRRLGGPSWRVTSAQYYAVLDDAERIHRAFERDKGARKRFPKMQYVLLRALDRHGVVPPYFVRWARTSIKRRQLADCLAVLDDEPPCS